MMVRGCTTSTNESLDGRVPIETQSGQKDPRPKHCRPAKKAELHNTPGEHTCETSDSPEYTLRDKIRLSQEFSWGLLTGYFQPRRHVRTISRRGRPSALDRTERDGTARRLNSVVLQRRVDDVSMAEAVE